MANYCSCWFSLEDCTSDQLRPLNALIEKDGGHIECPTQYMFLDEYELNLEQGVVWFQTKWGLHDDTVKFLGETLGMGTLVIYYEEGGNNLGGKVTYSEAYGISDQSVLEAYWEHRYQAYENEEEPPEIEDYFSEVGLIASQLQSAFNHIRFKDESDWLVLVAATLYKRKSEGQSQFKDIV